MIYSKSYRDSVEYDHAVGNFGGQMDPLKVARQAKEILRLQRVNAELEASRNYFRERCDVLEAVLELIDEKLIPPRSRTEQNRFLESLRNVDNTYEGVPMVPTFCEAFTVESLQNSQRHPNGRRWSRHMVEFCYILRSLGAKCYDFMRNFITLPVKRTLCLPYRHVTDEWRCSLLSLEGVSKICELFRRRHCIDHTIVIDVVLGVDAISMEPVTEDALGVKIGHNHVFLFHLMPLQCELKPICLHLQTQKGGNAGPAVRNRLEQLTSVLTALNFRVHYWSTDGDSGYATIHKELFDRWWPIYSGKGIEEALKTIEAAPKAILGDFLHILKNARSRLINGKVSLTYNGVRPFDAAEMDEILNLGKPLRDKSSTGKMKDSYALEIFTLDNCFFLLLNGRLEMAFYLLPYALWSCVMLHPKLSVQTRRDLLTLSIQVFEHHWRQLDYLKPGVVSENKTGDLVQFCCSRKHATRVMNTLMEILLELTNHPENLALSRLGTHDLECQFGIVRILCHYKHSWKNILKCFSKLAVMIDLTTQFGCPLQPRGRVNLGGVKIENDGSERFYQPADELNMPEVMQGISLALLKHKKTMDPNTQEIVDELDEHAKRLASYLQALLEWSKQCGCSVARLYTESDVAHTSIIARLVSFSGTPVSFSNAGPETLLDCTIGEETE